jgi:hypothetical protein
MIARLLLIASLLGFTAPAGASEIIYTYYSSLFHAQADYVNGIEQWGYIVDPYGDTDFSCCSLTLDKNGNVTDWFFGGSTGSSYVTYQYRSSPQGDVYQIWDFYDCDCATVNLSGPPGFWSVSPVDSTPIAGLSVESFALSAAPISETPLPSALSLVALGLGALGIFVALWRGKP